MNFIENFLDVSETKNNKRNDAQDILNKSGHNNGISSPELSSVKSTLNLNISEVTPSLYLSSATSVNASILEKLDITCVINAASELPDTPLPNDDIIYYKLCVHDTANADIQAYFDVTSDLIHEAESSGGRTLVHCVAGVSRSASLCIAFLMKHHNLSLLESYTYLKLKRPVVRPNCNFFRQLIDYELQLFGCTSVAMVYNEYVNAEIPDVYDMQYKGISSFRRKYKNNNSVR